MSTVELTIDLEAERQEILKRYRKLLRTAKPFLKDNDAKLIKKAFTLAADAHKDMRRKTGEPYIYHPIAVAQICVEEIGLGTTAIICALMHDVVEDTSYTLDDIENLFGPKVAKIIDGLTKIAGIFEQGASAQAENFRKLLLTLSEDVRVILIKLADRLHNMRTLSSMSRDKQLKIASETTYLYAPLAHRLGLYTIKTELEDLYLKYAEPKIYKEIAAKLKSTKTRRQQFIREFVRPIERDLKSEGMHFTVKGRPKSIHSIWNKIKNQGKSFEEIYDLFAIRVIIDSTPEQEKALCWRAYSIVTDHYRPNPERLRDWISNPRANGYESLHTTVMSSSGQWVEVQVRSRRMDEIAEKGYAAHWKYKGNNTNVNEGIDAWLNQVREVLEHNDSSAIEFINDFRGHLFQDEVFVFTPKGDLKVLQAGSTALDFAYSIHSHIGSHCLGAKVNGKLVEISHVLKNGDQVEILTSTKQSPREDWLKFVITTKARANIKEALKEINRQHVTEGRELVAKKLKNLGIELSFDITNQLRAYFNARDPNDLYYRFGKGYLGVEEIKRWKAARDAHKRAQEAKNTLAGNIEDSKSIVKELKRVHGDRPDSDMLLIGEDMDKFDYTLSACCNPIPGDEVFGFVTVNEGIKIHKTTCKNARELLSTHGNRVIKAKWSSQLVAFLAGIRIKGTDRVGLVNDVTKVISKEHKVNMRSIIVDTNEGGIFDGKIKLYVHDTEHLNTLISKLKKVKGVFEVLRFEYSEV
ncbi:RelA/SpoT family protein [Siphonobacter sp. BAB-5385]|uniref:Bifunctional (P)ppGpp synthetase/guanosine-3',5'-bis(Diphosphate) 3'-pyrophosphohydrolase n=1 Tax=Siphonobacter curvatus TaxID=2094562 RepID=A0A2S7INJ2_9BACT|nr:MULTISPECIES: bifunctional (p)ppGpp synthetase/guanosine-3',5'-bis(diphosphate) 3'-pyrophosphohydrolase [Siphonobacter]OZI06766.1 RelA/SpoT family protein [Siphonobacter sp. BAB-5385]PQA59265.1 bifunctional (p)ppGpp synthetase/guanosine-3',5'-bis(diphosphate) 3'-pyrophosphohydrolase [Siphonobacter curvatus]